MLTEFHEHPCLLWMTRKNTNNRFSDWLHIPQTLGLVSDIQSVHCAMPACGKHRHNYEHAGLCFVTLTLTLKTPKGLQAVRLPAQAWVRQGWADTLATLLRATLPLSRAHTNQSSCTCPPSALSSCLQPYHNPGSPDMGFWEPCLAE